MPNACYSLRSRSFAHVRYQTRCSQHGSRMSAERAHMFFIVCAQGCRCCYIELLACVQARTSSKVPRLVLRFWRPLQHGSGDDLWGDAHSTRNGDVGRRPSSEPPTPISQRTALLRACRHTHRTRAPRQLSRELIATSQVFFLDVCLGQGCLGTRSGDSSVTQGRGRNGRAARPAL